MKKTVSLLLIFILCFTSIGSVFAYTDFSDDDEYNKYLIAIENVNSDDSLSPELKEGFINAINRSYYSRNEINTSKFSTFSTRSSSSFSKIATVYQNSDQVEYTQNKLWACAAITGGPAVFLKKVPLIGQGMTALGGMFTTAAGVYWFSTKDLEDGAVNYAETWLRWTNEAMYEYECYSITYVKMNGYLISEKHKSSTWSGDFME